VEVFRSRTRASAERHERARAVFPGGETRSAAFFRPYPVHVARADGAELIDVDGNRYVDFVFNYGAVVLGHRHPAVLETAERGLRNGISFAAPGIDQIELAEELLGRLTSAERLRFVTSGTEANITALRAARAFTRRDVVVKAIGGFHGTIPELDRDIRGVRLPRGVPAGSAVVAVPYNDTDALVTTVRDLGERCAAVILETVLYSGGIVPARRWFLQAAQEVAREVGALLILDEVATFRLAPGGHQGDLGVAPDVTTVGKIVGGGFPVGAVAGREDVMAVYDLGRADAIPHSGTYNGNPVTAAAGRAVMARMTSNAYAQLARRGAQLAAGLRAAIASSGAVAQISDVGSMVNIHFTDAALENADAVLGASPELAAAFHLGMLDRGIFCAPRGLFLVSLATEATHVERAVEAASQVLANIAEALA